MIFRIIHNKQGVTSPSPKQTLHIYIYIETQLAFFCIWYWVSPTASVPDSSIFHLFRFSLCFIVCLVGIETRFVVIACHSRSCCPNEVWLVMLTFCVIATLPQLTVTQSIYRVRLRPADFPDRPRLQPLSTLLRLNLEFSLPMTTDQFYFLIMID